MIEYTMSSDVPATIGIAISKDTLDAHRLPDGRHRRFGNDPAGHRALASWIGTSAVVRASTSRRVPITVPWRKPSTGPAFLCAA